MPHDDPRLDTLVSDIKGDKDLTTRDRDDFLDEINDLLKIEDPHLREQEFLRLRGRYRDWARTCRKFDDHFNGCPVNARIVRLPDGTIKFTWPSEARVAEIAGEACKSSGGGALAVPAGVPFVGGQRVPWSVIRIAVGGALLLLTVLVWRSSESERSAAFKVLHDYKSQLQRFVPATNDVVSARGG